MEKNTFYILSVQCVMFFAPYLALGKDSKGKLLSELLSKCADTLDGEPTILPIPIDAPPDIPRLQIASKDNAYAYGISLLRSDLTYNQNGEPQESLSGVSPNLFNCGKKIIDIYQNTFHWKIERLGFIVNFITSLNTESSAYISEKFVKDDPKCESIELSLLTKDRLNSFNINRWIRIRSVEKKKELLHVMVDVNTLAEEKLNMSTDQLLSFYTASVSYIEKQLGQTFHGVKL